VTKVEAIKKVMEDNGGTATWDIIYSNIEKYYPAARASAEWQAGLRGVLYREIKDRRNFKKIGFGIFALKEYEEEQEEQLKTDKIRMHSFIEGICLELGNFENFDTYTPDPTVIFKDNIYLKDLRTIDNIPIFTYNEIVNSVKRIDVLWFNKKGYKYPKRAFEVVDSIGTLGEALNRTFQLAEFNLNFYIVGAEKDRARFDDKITREPYVRIKDRFIYKNYNEVIDFYNKKLEIEKMSFFK